MPTLAEADLYVGETPVQRVYLGTTLVWERAVPVFYAHSRIYNDLGAQTKIVKFDMDGNQDELYVPDVGNRPGRSAPANFCRPIVSVNGDVGFYVLDNPYDTDHPLAPFAGLRFVLNGTEITSPPDAWTYQGHAEFSPDGTQLIQAVLRSGGSDFQLAKTPIDQSSETLLAPTETYVEPSWTEDGITCLDKVSSERADPQTIDPSTGSITFGPINEDAHCFDPYRNGDLVIWLQRDGLDSGIRIHNITNAETEWLIPMGSRPGRISQARWVPGMPNHIVLCEQNADPNTYWKAMLFDINDISNPTELTGQDNGSIEQVFATLVDVT